MLRPSSDAQQDVMVAFNNTSQYLGDISNLVVLIFIKWFKELQSNKSNS
jgi:hypothetical protein